MDLNEAEPLINNTEQQPKTEGRRITRTKQPIKLNKVYLVALLILSFTVIPSMALIMLRRYR